MSDITTTDKMNEMIKDLLRRSKEPFKLYILARIEQLEAENSTLHAQTVVVRCGDCYYFSGDVCCCDDSTWCADFPPEDCSCKFGKTREDADRGD